MTQGFAQHPTLLVTMPGEKCAIKIVNLQQLDTVAKAFSLVMHGPGSRHTGVPNLRHRIFDLTGQQGTVTGNFDNRGNTAWNRLHAVRGKFIH
ncbi:hypothetical protein PS3A_45060 [Pseudomonas sp. 3A(2025)]